jgi:hypothetical protein
MELFSFLFLLSPPHNFNHFFYSHILEICLVSSGWSSAYRLRLWYTPVRLGISLTTVKHRSSNITILLLPAVTNCDIVSKTTRQRQQKSQPQISFFFYIEYYTHTSGRFNTNQWNPLHPTDLGPTLIGISRPNNGVDHRDHNDHREVYLLPIAILMQVPIIQLQAIRGLTVLFQQLSIRPQLFSLHTAALRLTVTLHLTVNNCLEAIRVQAQTSLHSRKTHTLPSIPRTTSLWSS